MPPKRASKKAAAAAAAKAAADNSDSDDAVDVKAKPAAARPKRNAKQSADGDADPAPAQPAKKPAARGRKAAAAAAADDGNGADTAAPAAPAPAAPKKGRAKKAAAKAAADASPDPAAASTATATTTAAAAAAASSTAASSSSSSSAAAPAPSDSKKIKVVRKGRAPVDQFCRIKDKVHVYEEGDDVYNVMLNQTNIGQNNNKYYVIQLLESDTGSDMHLFTRWGRVGDDGQHALTPVHSKQDGKSSFMKKFREKTKNDWNNRANFKTVSGFYTLIELDYGDDTPMPDAAAPAAAPASPKALVESKLDKRVQDLVSLIFDLKMMERTMVEMEYDVTKQPLGKLSKKIIKDGYDVLKEIEAAMNAHQTNKLSELSSRFYTLIPHAYKRSELPPVINNSELLRKKMQMLEALADIEIATKIMSDTKASDDRSSVIDREYARLNTDMHPVDKGSDEWKQIEEYLRKTTTRGKLTLLELFTVERKGEPERFDKTKHMGNRRLLWHGSRLSNFVGILSTGLRIAPPEAPVTGYRFGKGLYFADIASLSAGYCRVDSSGIGCMLLAEVALGKQYECPRDEFMTSAKPGSDSTWALGTEGPKPEHWVKHPDGYVIPVGDVVSSGRTGVSCREHQYVTYTVDQSRLRYLLKLKWG